MHGYFYLGKYVFWRFKTDTEQTKNCNSKGYPTGWVRCTCVSKFFQSIFVTQMTIIWKFEETRTTKFIESVRYDFI